MFTKLRDISLTVKLVTFVAISVFFGVGFIVATNYVTTFNAMKESAGLELYGCANITTGIINVNSLSDLIEGDGSKKQEIEQQISWTVSKKPIFQSHYILSLDGTVLAADDEYQKQGVQAGETHPVPQSILDKIKAGDKKVYSEIYTFAGMERLTGYAPIYQDHDESKEVIAINAVDFNAGIVEERTWNVVKNTMLAGLILPILLTIITFFVMKNLVKYIAQITVHSEKVAKGDLRIQRIEVKSDDEVGRLTKYFNRMVDSLKELISKIMVNSATLKNTTDELSSSSEHATEVTEQITVSIQEVANGAERQLETTNKTEQLVIGISEQMKDITAKMLAVKQAANQTLELAGKGKKIVGDSIDQMNEIGDNTTSIGNVIHHLNDKSKEISQITGMISDISEQTNMLALNAAIEAARAGDAGKGFAVVASEVRKLAEQSGKASTKISVLINEIQVDTEKAVKVMGEGERSVSQGVVSVTNARNSFDEISDSLDSVTGQVNDVSGAVEHIGGQMSSMVSALHDISTISRNTAQKTQDIAASTEEQNAFIEELSAAMHHLADMADELNGMVYAFKLEDQ